MMKRFSRKWLAVSGVGVFLVFVLLLSWSIPRYLLCTTSFDDFSAVLPRPAVRYALKTFVLEAPSFDEKFACLRSLDAAYSNLEYFQPHIGELIRSDYRLSGYGCTLFLEKKLIPTEEDLALARRLSEDESVAPTHRVSARAVLEKAGQEQP